MSGLRLGAALTAALLLSTPALAAHLAYIPRHHHHAHLVGPGIVGPNWDLYGPNVGGPAPVYNGSYGAFGGGELYDRGSGGINAMSNDFGTSGVLGHTNGMPAGR